MSNTTNYQVGGEVTYYRRPTILRSVCYKFM